MTSIAHKYFIALFPGYFWVYRLLILNELNIDQLKKFKKYPHHWKFFIQLGDRNIKDDVPAALSSL